MIAVIFVFLVLILVFRTQIFNIIVRELGEVDRFQVAPSLTERPGLWLDLGLSYAMKELVKRLSRLKDAEEA